MEALLHGKEYTRTGYGKAWETSENELELTALCRALARMSGEAGAAIYSGNRYIASAILNGWPGEWERAGWVNAAGRPVAHAGLWQEAAGMLHGREVSVELCGRHKYSHWQRFQLGKLRTLDFIRWEEGLSRPDANFA